MTLDEFAETTKRVMAADGFEEYFPTAIYPDPCHIRIMEGLPPDIEPGEAVIRWALESAQDGEEFLVAFRVDESHFKVIRRIGVYSEDETYLVTDSISS